MLIFDEEYIIFQLQLSSGSVLTNNIFEYSGTFNFYEYEKEPFPCLKLYLKKKSEEKKDNIIEVEVEEVLISVIPLFSIASIIVRSMDEIKDKEKLKLINIIKEED